MLVHCDIQSTTATNCCPVQELAYSISHTRPTDSFLSVYFPSCGAGHLSSVLIRSSFDWRDVKPTTRMQHDVVYEARPRSEVIRQGYLTKSPPLDGGATVFKKWQRRWVVFRCDDGNVNLQYFRGEKDVHGTPLGTVMLDDCTGVQKSMKHSHYKNIFAINTPSRDYFFSADSK